LGRSSESGKELSFSVWGGRNSTRVSVERINDKGSETKGILCSLLLNMELSELNIMRFTQSKLCKIDYHAVFGGTCRSAKEPGTDAKRQQMTTRKRVDE